MVRHISRNDIETNMHSLCLGGIKPPPIGPLLSSKESAALESPQLSQHVHPRIRSPVASSGTLFRCRCRPIRTHCSTRQLQQWHFAMLQHDLHRKTPQIPFLKKTLTTPFFTHRPTKVTPIYSRGCWASSAAFPSSALFWPSTALPLPSLVLVLVLTVPSKPSAARTLLS